MTVREHQLIYHPDGEHQGWLEHNAPDYFTPGDSLTAAHDLLEHPPGLRGPAAEIAAFGAIIFGRYEGGYDALTGVNFTNPAAMGMELHGLIEAEDFGFQLSDLPDPAEAYDLFEIPVGAKADSADLEAMVQGFLDRHQPEYPWNRLSYKVGEWANLGYLWAEKRYGNSQAMAELFFDLENKVKALECDLSSRQILDVIITTERGSPLHAEVRLWEGYHPEEECFYEMGEPEYYEIDN